MHVTLKNKYNGDIRTVKKGFSWTTLFWGILVPLARGDWKWFIFMTIASFLTSGLSLLVFPFIYNSLYITELQSNGYTYH